MKRLGHIFAVLVFALTLLMGAEGGVMAQVGSMDHHGSHHAPSDSVPSHEGSHKAALVLAAPCCPAAEAPTGHAIAVPMTLTEASWHSRLEYIPAVRDITPDTPPPKFSL
jgi:hypothetical protein